MTVVDDFMLRYQKEFDFYREAAQVAARTIEARLGTEGIRAIVSSRAKDPKRAETKCLLREPSKQYRRVDDIYDDIVDLAGVRVALYFPGDQQIVSKLISDVFDVLHATEFPDETPRPGKKFSGYGAKHYRVRLRANTVADPRYASARIEIQVASVLMHAWAEVEHDLVYKPGDATLSDQELMILDELNGLVLAGELALHRLQTAGEERASRSEREFRNHYDLAAYLLSRLSRVASGPLVNEGLGRVDLLFDLISQVDVNKPEALEPYLANLHADLDRRPLAEQVIDSLLQEDPSRYGRFMRIRDRSRGGDDQSSDYTRALGAFLSEWVDFEKLLESKLGLARDARRRLPVGLQIDKLTADEPAIRGELQFIRQLRNRVVHGSPDIAVDDLQQARETLRQLVDYLRMKDSPSGGDSVPGDALN